MASSSQVSATYDVSRVCATRSPVLITLDVLRSSGKVVSGFSISILATLGLCCFVRPKWIFSNQVGLCAVSTINVSSDTS